MIRFWGLPKTSSASERLGGSSILVFVLDAREQPAGVTLAATMMGGQ